MRRHALALVLFALLAAPSGVSAASLQPIGDFDKPIYIASDPGDPDRLLVAEREGRVILAEDGSASVFADLTHLVECCESERGLLSIAPAPDFGVTGRFYAAYTGKTAAGAAIGDIHIDAFRLGESGSLVREPIVSIDHSTNKNHNGGQLQFGPDGYLYISVGDGGGGGDPFDAAQDLDSLLGKILRLDPRPGESPSYAFPSGNPFAAPGDGAREEIWAYGLRNPWRFSFDRASGDMIVADVGQGAREEINFAPSPTVGSVGGAGANYGWDCREGTIEYTGPSSEACDGASGFTDPVFDYPHVDPEDGSAHGCSITGGYVVRDVSLEGLYGRYVYGDFCVGEIRSIDLGAANPRATDRVEPGLAVPAASLYSFGEDSCGRIYVVLGSGAVSRLEGDVPADCAETAGPGAEGSGAIPNGTGPGAPFSSPLPALRAATKVHAKVIRTLVEAGQRAAITARVSPCEGREGDRILLKHAGRVVQRRRLNEKCVAWFRPRLLRHRAFRVRVPGTPLFLPASSGRLAA